MTIACTRFIIVRWLLYLRQNDQASQGLTIGCMWSRCVRSGQFPALHAGRRNLEKWWARQGERVASGWITPGVLRLSWRSAV